MKVRTQKQKASRSGERGFSLVETAIACVVLMIVGLGAAGGFVYAIRYNSGAADRAASMSIAQATIEKLRNSSFTDTLKKIAVQVSPVNDSSGLGALTNSYYGAVMLVGERCSPVAGTNIN